jgi:hypothetical protein
MKRLIPLLAVQALSASEGSTDIYVFGASYHTNTEYSYNGENYGVGVGFAYYVADNTEITIIQGAYIDSFDQQAVFVMPGVRHTVGDRNGLHSSLGLNAGLFSGSGFNGFGFMPTATIGYDRVDLCVTGLPNMTDNNPSTDDPRQGASTGVIGAFIKLRIAEW